MLSSTEESILPLLLTTEREISVFGCISGERFYQDQILVTYTDLESFAIFRRMQKDFQKSALVLQKKKKKTICYVLELIEENQKPHNKIIGWLGTF